MQAAIMKLLLTCLQSVRELKGACHMVYTIKVDSIEYVKMKGKLQANDAKAQEMRKGHGLGPPSVFAFGGFFWGLESREDSIEEFMRLALPQTGARRLLGQAPECGLEESISRAMAALELAVVCQSGRHPQRVVIVLGFVVSSS